MSQNKTNELMKKRVYGIIGVKSEMANWNADFTGRPKSTGNGDIYGSDKALKYTQKKYWENNDLPVLYMKSYKVRETEVKEKIDGKEVKTKVEKIQPRDLAERYQQLFKKPIEPKTPYNEVLKNLFSAIDVMNFGATFAEKEQNISITGVVQVGQGFNKYDDSRVEVQDILSPFRNSNDKSENKDASTLGTKIMSDEAHYFYPFAVNPENYNCYLGLEIENFNGYTKEAYDLFKEASLVSATAFNTNSKMGCENEFAMFIECKEESKVYIPDMAQYLEFTKEDGKSLINLTRLKFIEKYIDQIENVEIYYNDMFVSVKTAFNEEFANKVKLFNIFTKGEINESN